MATEFASVHKNKELEEELVSTNVRQAHREVLLRETIDSISNDLDKKYEEVQSWVNTMDGTNKIEGGIKK